jgi:hypothetical protein
MLESMEQVLVLKEKFFQMLFGTLQDKQGISTVLYVAIKWSLDAGRRAPTCVGVNIVKSMLNCKKTTTIPSFSNSFTQWKNLYLLSHFPVICI